MNDHQFPHNRVVAVLVWLCLATHLPGQSTNLSVLPVPEWVRLCGWSMPTNQPGNEKSQGWRYLLYERQFHPQEKETFIRVVRLMENATGVQDCGSLTFGFDPSYQELRLHRVQIQRAGEVLNRLDLSKVKLIQPEPELEGHVFTGEHRAVLFVEDLRVGDALEYAYSLRGANPVLNGHFSTQFFIQSSQPIERQRLRVVWPSAKALLVRPYLTAVAPSQQPCAGGLEYLWDFERLEGIPYEDDLPVTYEPYPYIELSDFDGWSRVVEWALPLYSVGTSNLPTEARELLGKWQAAAASDEERARLALDFVQDELRYTGIELGPDSYRPTEPAETFRLRFGDCKAKANLLCTLLRQLGIEAYPALVNTSARETVAERLPSPFAFNHAIVKVLLEGKALWVDPTRSHQGGRLSERYLPPLRKALVVKKGVTTLEDVPPCAGALQRVTSTFRLKDYGSPASLIVSTVYRGVKADSMREYLAGTDAKQIATDYLNFYARYYAGIHQLRPLEINDQRTSNLLAVTEYYQITNLWELNKSSQRLEAVFYAESLEKMLTEPDTRLRKMPLAISYPTRHEQEIIVQLPDDQWQVSPLTETVESEAFAFYYRRSFSGSTARFDYACETKAPAVPAEKVADYLKKREQMQDLLTDTLYRPDTRPGAVLRQINWLMVVVAGFGAAAALAGGIWSWRSMGSAGVAVGVLPPPLPLETSLRGLGGWLVLVGFGLCASLLWRPASVVQNWEGFFSTVAWQSVALPGGDHYHPLYGPLLIFEVLGNILLLALNVLALCLFFGRRKLFPRIYITLLVANLVFVLVDELAGGAIPYVAQHSHDSSARGIFRAALQAIIWVSYMVKSRRVKATFVR